MKNTITLIILVMATLGLNAQQTTSPLFFHHQQEYLQYQMEHPENIPLNTPIFSRTDYTQKLDSVIGSDNFDWSRWKNVYSFAEAPDFLFKEEIHYEWENQTWTPVTKTKTSDFLASENTIEIQSYRWKEEDWEFYREAVYSYSPSDNLLQDVTSFNIIDDTIREGATRSTYEYDDNGQLVLNMNYNGINAEGEWNPSSKYEYAYNEDGTLAQRLYSTIRNGAWRAASRDTLRYENGLCVSWTSQRRGWGQGSNSWMDAGRYEFEYEDGALVSEWYYTAGFGWFNPTLTLDSKTNYEFDALGNLKTKTASVFNESDWIVRDIYDNVFDQAVNASEVLGLTALWETTLNKGMNYVLNMDLPLQSKWNSCNIASSNLDTEFKIYCSGFASVNESQQHHLQVAAGKGRIIVDCPEASDISVYDLTGRRVASAQQTLHSEFQLRPGLYLVGNDKEFIKTVIY